MRSMRGPALVLGIVLLSSAAGLTYQATQSASEAASNQSAELQTAAANAEVLLSKQFERAGAIGLFTAQDDIFREFFKEPGSTQAESGCRRSDAPGDRWPP